MNIKIIIETPEKKNRFEKRNDIYSLGHKCEWIFRSIRMNHKCIVNVCKTKWIHQIRQIQTKVIRLKCELRSKMSFEELNDFMQNDNFQMEICIQTTIKIITKNLCVLIENRLNRCAWNCTSFFEVKIRGVSRIVYGIIVSPKQPRAILLCYNSLDPVSCGVRRELFTKQHKNRDFT